MKSVFVLTISLAWFTGTAPVHAQSSVRINEVLARNATLARGGLIADWVELVNTSASPVDVSDASLTDTAVVPRRYVLRAGTSIPAFGHLVIFCNAAPASATNTGFALKHNGGAVYLYARTSQGGGQLDAIAYGLQTADSSIGRVPNGGDTWTLCVPTYAASNAPVALGPTAHLKINEWLAAPRNNDPDFIEIYNGGLQPVSLGSLSLSDSLNKPRKHVIAPLSFIGTGAANGYALFYADEQLAQGADHVYFKLSADGESIGLFAANSTAIDTVTFGPQATGASEGRLPDGAADIARFYAPSPGRPNRLLTELTNVVINELLAHTDLPLEDAVELHNLTDGPINIGGWYLSNDETDLARYRIPTGTLLPARGFKAFYEYQFNSLRLPNRFNLNSAHGGYLCLIQADASSNLLAIARQSYSASENAISFGRHEKSDGVDFVALSRRTFGMDAPASVDQFRQGTGRTNAYPKVGPLVIHEIMYRPPDLEGADNSLDEFIELRNITGSPVALYDPQYPTNHWQLRNGIDYIFPSSVVMGPNSYLLVVNFDPATNAPQAAAFRALYSVPAGVRLLGPYAGKLDNDGEAIELYKPDPVQLPPHPDAGFVPYILADKVKYNDRAPWPEGTDGTGYSLQRKAPTLYGDDPVNWKSDAPTAGCINAFPPVITHQPLSHWAYAGDTITLEVGATGTPPLAYQWRFNGAAIARATNTSLVITNFKAANAGNYTVTVQNIAATATSVVASVKGDFTKPTVSITTPTANARLTNALLLVRGKASDSQGLDRVEVRLNGGDVLLAEGTTNWQAPLRLVAGTNVIQARSVDFGRNASSDATVRVFFVVTNRLTLVTNPPVGGTIAGVANGQLLEINRSYTATAAAKTTLGYAFTNWTSTTNGWEWVTSSTPALRFTMQTNLLLSANFVDVKKPTLTITAPVANRQVSNILETARGTAADNAAIVGVNYQLNTAPWELAEGTTNWSAPLHLTVPGTNTLRAYATDAAGNCSLTNSVKFVFTGVGMLLKPVCISNAFSVTINTVTGKQYILEYKDSLTETHWRTAASITGDGKQRLLSDQTAIVRQRFYRVRQ